MRYPLWRVIAFAAVTVVLTVAEYLTIRSSVFAVIDTVLTTSNPMVAGLPILQILISAIAGIALAGIILLLHSKKDVKIF